MADRLEETFRQAIAERVADAAPPRPFEALPDGTRKRRTNGWFDMDVRNNQRGLLIGAMASVVIVAGGIWFAVGRDSNDVIGVATEPTLDGTTTVPPVTNGSDDTEAGEDQTLTTRSTDPDPAGSILVELSCANGEASSVDVPAGQEDQIDDVVNSVDGCEGRGGLVAVTFTGCGDLERTVVIPADENGGLPDFATLDYCEDDVETATTTTLLDPTTSVLTEPSTGGDLTVTVGFTCGDGGTGSSDFNVDDIDELDDLLNTIDLCEGSGGLTEISFDGPCGDTTRTVDLSTPDGEVPDIATIDYCE